MMKRISVCVMVAMALSGCASTSRMLSYGGEDLAGTADAKFQSGGREYVLWLHRKEQMMMLQRGLGTVFGKSVVQGLTYGLVEARDPYSAWKQAATDFVAPVDCTISDVRPIDQDTAWEAAYKCPNGVDLLALVVAQRASLRKGGTLTK